MVGKILPCVAGLSKFCTTHDQLNTVDHNILWRYIKCGSDFFWTTSSTLFGAQMSEYLLVIDGDIGPYINLLNDLEFNPDL